MKTNHQVTVFGATGKIGRELIRLLSNNGIPTLALTRSLEKVIQRPFITWMQADLADKNSLNATMAPGGSVFLLSGHSHDFVDNQANAIQVAARVGVHHVIKLSSGAADKTSEFYIPKTHGIVEDILISSGMKYTMLRPNGIMQNWLGEIAEGCRSGRKFHEATGSGKRSHVDLRDIAEVAYKCLVDGTPHYDRTYMLTSDRAVNYYEVAEAIGIAIGEEVRYVPISLAEARRDMERKGMPSELIDTFIFYDTAQLNGETETVSDCVRAVLGRPARTLEQFALDYAATFR